MASASFVSQGKIWTKPETTDFGENGGHWTVDTDLWGNCGHAQHQSHITQESMPWSQDKATFGICRVISSPQITSCVPHLGGQTEFPIAQALNSKMMKIIIIIARLLVKTGFQEQDPDTPRLHSSLLSPKSRQAVNQRVMTM